MHISRKYRNPIIFAYRIMLFFHFTFQSFSAFHYYFIYMSYFGIEKVKYVTFKIYILYNRNEMHVRIFNYISKVLMRTTHVHLMT